MTFGKIGATPTMKRWTARDYVQDGLVAMWDGVENAGYGQHHNAAPVDLVNGVQLTAVGSPVITDTTFDTPQGAYYYADIAGFKDAVNNKDFTLELVMSNVRASNTGIFSIGDRGVWVYGSGTYNLQVVNLLATYYTQAINLTYQNDGVFNISVVGGTTPKGIVGTTEHLGSYGALESISQSRCYIGGMNGNGVFSPSLKSFRCVRLYSRALTAAEIAYNYNIDKLRFNLP